MQVTIVTSQNVPIDYEIAGLGSRIAATIIDLLIRIGYMLGMGLLLSQMQGFLSGTVIGLIILLPPLCYDLVCEIFMNGQSFGKRQVDIRVVKLDGTQPTISSYLLRWMLEIVDGIPLLYVGGFMTMLINGKGQRLGDLAAGTTVISTRARVALDDTILSAAEEGYAIVFPEVTKLSDRDIAIIKEVLDISRRDRNADVLKALATKVRTVLDVDSGEMTPMQFLQTVLKDYNQSTS